MSRHPVTGRTSLLAGAAGVATALFAFAGPAAATDGQAGAHENTQAAAGMTVTAARVRGAARQYTLTPRQRQQVERLREDTASELIRSGSEPELTAEIRPSESISICWTICWPDAGPMAI